MREREVIKGEVEDDTRVIDRGIIQLIDQENPLQVMIALMAEIITIQVNHLKMRQTVMGTVQVTVWEAVQLNIQLVVVAIVLVSIQTVLDNVTI